MLQNRKFLLRNPNITNTEKHRAILAFCPIRISLRLYLSLSQTVQDSLKPVRKIVGCVLHHHLLDGAEMIEKLLNRQNQGTEASTAHAASNIVANLLIETQGAYEHREVTKGDKSMGLLKR